MSDPVLRNWSDEELLKFIQSNGVGGSMSAGDYAVDAGRGLASGGANVVSGIAGLPGDVQALARAGAQSMTGGAMPAALPDQQLPTSSAVRGGIEQMTGPIPEPKTALGGGIRTAVEMAPAALFPAQTGIQRALNVAGPTIGSIAGEYMTNGSPTGKLVGALVGGAAGARGIKPHAASPERMALVRQLEGEGVPLTAGQRTGNKALQWRGTAAGGKPVSGGRGGPQNEGRG